MLVFNDFEGFSRALPFSDEKFSDVKANCNILKKLSQFRDIDAN